MNKHWMPPKQFKVENLLKKSKIEAMSDDKRSYPTKDYKLSLGGN